MPSTFGNFDFQQFIYHFRFGLKEQVIGDKRVIWSFIKLCILCPILFASFLTTVEVIIKKIKQFGAEKVLTQVYPSHTKMIAETLDIIVRSTERKIFRWAPSALLSFSTIFLAETLSVRTHFSANLSSHGDFFAEHYV